MSVSLIDGHIDEDVMTSEELIEELEKVRYNVTSEYHKTVIDATIDTLQSQKAEIERLTEEQDRTVKDFTEFARTAYDIPFACKYCAHSIEDSRACLWKAEHEDEEEACLGRHFEYK